MAIIDPPTSTTTRTPRVAGRPLASARLPDEELRHRMLEILSHELGNAATPILMIGNLLPQHSVDPAFLHRVDALKAAGMRLHALSRTAQRLGGWNGSISGRMSSVRNWWSEFEDFVAGVLPPHVTLSADLPTLDVQDSVLSALTRLVPAAALSSVVAMPSLVSLALSIESKRDMLLVQLTAIGRDPAAVRPERHAWFRHVRKLARVDEGSARFSVSAGAIRCVLQVPSTIVIDDL